MFLWCFVSAVTCEVYEATMVDAQARNISGIVLEEEKGNTRRKPPSQCHFVHPQTQCGIPWDRITVSWWEAAPAWYLTSSSCFQEWFTGWSLFGTVMSVISRVGDIDKNLCLSSLHHLQETSYCASIITFVKNSHGVTIRRTWRGWRWLLFVNHSPSSYLELLLPVIKIVIVQTFVGGGNCLMRPSVNCVCVCVCVCKTNACD